MKKFIIKNADGSEQTVMQAVHNSRKEAVETFMDYICDQKNFLSIDDDDYLSPFDFTLEEVECPQVNEVITDFKRARKALGLKPNTCYNLSEHVPKFVSDINPKHIEALIALNKLFTIAQAWNEADEFVPDFSDWNQDKWFPWFEYNKNVAGFVYATTGNTPTAGHTLIGSRLCFKTSERAAQFGKQFAKLYNKVFFIKTKVKEK